MPKLDYAMLSDEEKLLYQKSCAQPENTMQNLYRLSNKIDKGGISYLRLAQYGLLYGGWLLLSLKARFYLRSLLKKYECDDVLWHTFPRQI